jgi:hypothetical protein
MLVTPAATAQLLTVRFGPHDGPRKRGRGRVPRAGLYLSYWLDAASGATIVLVQTGSFLVVLAVGPRTGLLARRRTGPSATEAGTIG